ncbi:hypothetical protein QFC21_004523 [Naganishia friedmannii]|uniref:Uncharacterized protein n=1 Tax=Naganishia friedmannii TaxID=89922 RepID=A0ACC2VGA7_9TREE|nr:hypothetical protein QFC21_004523 [Naganishia friedmannii]
MSSYEFAQPPPPKRARTQSHSSTDATIRTTNLAAIDLKPSSSRSTQAIPATYGRDRTANEIDEDADLFMSSGMTIGIGRDVSASVDDLQKPEMDIGKADGSGISASKDKDSDGGSGSYRARPLAVTCTHCRTRKIKCDNGKPNCSNCMKAGAECVYLTKQKPGLKAGTGETMLKRIGENVSFANTFSADQVYLHQSFYATEALEESFAAYKESNDSRVIELEERLRRNAYDGNLAIPFATSVNSTGPALIDRILTDSPHQSDIFQLKRESIAAGMLDLASGSSSLPHHPPNGQNGIYDVGSSRSQQHDGSRMSFSGHPPPPQHQYSQNPGLGQSPSNMLASVENNQMQMYPYTTDQNRSNGSNYNTIPSPLSYEAPIWTEGASLPRDDIVHDLIRLFFEKVAPWAFILIPRADQVWEPPWDEVAHAMVVISLRFSKDERLIPYKQRIYDAARKHVFIQSMDTTSIETMQALALLALDVIGSGKGPEHWSVLSLLTRAAITMDLLRESDSQQSLESEAVNDAQTGSLRFPSVLSKTKILQPPVMWQDDEARRRLFWLIFVLDRYTCTATAWDNAIPQADIKRRLPCADELWKGIEWFQSDTFMSPLSLYGRSSASLATLHPSAFFVEALDLLGRAHSLQSRPVDMQDPRAMESRRDATSAITSAAKRWYHDIQPAIGKLEDERPMEPLHLLTHAMYHALSCRVTVRDVNAPAVSPVFIWTCWIAARIMFVHACLSARTNMDPEFQILLASLRIMAEEWQLADEYVKLLSRAERRWQSLSTDLTSPASGTLSEAVSVLLDMRRTAYTAAKVGQYDVTPPEPAGGHGMNAGGNMEGPFGSATPVWPPTLKGPFAQAAGYGDIGSWFDSLDLFGNSSTGLLP